MNKYLLKFIKQMKKETLIGSPYKVKKYVSKFWGKYFGTVYIITDAKHKIRIDVRSEKQKDEIWPVIFIDRQDCFDKPAKCPIQLPVPKNEKEYEKLFMYIQLILIDDSWYDISNEYQTEKWVKGYGT